ncbi:MAG: sulfurtransferase TusA family protein [Methanomicrobiales archaeon]|nr:sulfurtransferase TusA family protein [Methanomicrobiales archaeon]
MGTNLKADAELDFVELPYVRPGSLIGEVLKSIKPGHLLKVKTENPEVKEDVNRWVEKAGQEIAKVEEEGRAWIIYIKRVH